MVMVDISISYSCVCISNKCTFVLMSVESEGAGRDLRTSLVGGLEEVQAEVRQLRQVVDTSMEIIAHQALAQSTKEVSLKFPSRYLDLSYI